MVNEQLHQEVFPKKDFTSFFNRLGTIYTKIYQIRPEPMF